MTETSTKADKQYELMTKTPVGKLIIKLGIPTTVSMLVTNIYNMADTYFVGTLGTSASGAVGIVFGLMLHCAACPEHPHGAQQHDQRRCNGQEHFEAVPGSIHQNVVGVFLFSKGRHGSHRQDQRYDVLTHARPSPGARRR